MRAIGTTLVVFALLAAIATAARGSEGSASKLSGREAARAVREEIGNNWLSLGTFPRSVRARGASAEIECTGMSAGKQVCDWSATNVDRGQHAEGVAVVIARLGGAEAKLYAYDCQGPEGLACY